MRTFIVTYISGYGLNVMIINSDSVQSASELALENGAWKGFHIEEIDNNREGIIYSEYS